MAYESDIYAKYAAGELSEEERLKLEQSGELAELDKILQATDKLKLPAYDFDMGYAQLKQRNLQVAKPSILRRLALPLSIAASLFLLIGAFIIFNNLKTTIITDNRNTKIHTFKDGSSITLNDASTIHFNERNWDKIRRVEVYGEACFKVTSGVPFIVETDYGNIKVLGTSFNVRTHDDLLEVKCFSGKVQVINQKGNQKTLNAKEKIRLLNQQFDSIKLVEESQPLWQNGISEFENTSAQLVFKEIERQYDLIVLGNIPDEKFTGRFVHQNLPDALEQICKPLNLEYTFNKEEIYINAK